MSEPCVNASTVLPEILAGIKFGGLAPTSVNTKFGFGGQWQQAT